MPLSAATLAPSAPIRSVSPQVGRETADPSPSIIGRALGGTALLGVLAVSYLALLLANRLWISTNASKQRLDRWGSARFTAYIVRHGGMLIKIGQFVASRPDLFPNAYIEACAGLRDQAPPRPYSEIRRVLDRTYEGRVDERFARIEEQALAAASFGQVHRAWLHDGRPVAVKVQHPGLERLVTVDLALTRGALRLLAVTMRGFPFRDLCIELERASRDELDYLNEATSADRLRPCLARHGVRVPSILWEHTREKVLVMEFADGATLARTDLSALGDDERLRVASRIIDAYLGMLLEEGFFHADPHAGNFIYRSGEIWLIDFGMTASVTRHQAELYRRFMVHVQRQDTDGMIDVMLELGFVLPELEREDLRALARELYQSMNDLAPQALKGSRRQLELGARINDMLRRSRGIVFPQHTIMLSRAISLMEGLCMELVPATSFLSLVRSRLQTVITPTMQIERLVEEAAQTWKSLRTLPERLVAAAAQRSAFPSAAIVSGCVLIAALQLGTGWPQVIAVAAAGIAMLASLRRSG
ncbi:MAG: AarF/ABC1/UbiB kinase family protein [Planctomycetes bacterium]|nr:AarF/ABC1/UbiB kinase family protein [Planctomycetota bacterium]